MREKLPDRRETLTRRVLFRAPGGRETFDLDISAGYIPGAPPDGRILEVFIHAVGKVGSMLHYLLDDEGVAISLLLQHGLTPAGLRARLGAPVDAGGHPASLIAAVVDELVAMQGEIAAIWKPPARRSLGEGGGEGGAA